jgi:C1A family cysteine protease
MNQNEFRKMLGLLGKNNKIPDTADKLLDTKTSNTVLGYPATFDHRTNKSVTSVKDQG